MAGVKPLEKHLLKQIETFLTILKLQNCLTYRRIQISAVPQKGGRLFSKSKMVGMSDLVIWIKNGPTLCVELKVGKNTLSKHQSNFRTEIEAVGHKYLVWRSLEDAQSCMQGLKIYSPVRL